MLIAPARLHLGGGVQGSRTSVHAGRGVSSLSTLPGLHASLQRSLQMNSRYKRLDNLSVQSSFGWDRAPKSHQSEDGPSYVVIWPSTFGEAASAISALRNQRNVVINLSCMGDELTEQQRTVDFIAGGCYALGGSQERLADRIFLFTPKGVEVQSAPEEERKAHHNALLTLARTSLFKTPSYKGE